MKKDELGLTRKQHYALLFFASCTSIYEASRQSGIVPQTYYKWLQNPTFRQALEKEKARIREEAMHILKASLHKATEKLVQLLEAVSESIQRQAANDIIHYVQKDREINEIEARIEQLENKVRK